MKNESYADFGNGYKVNNLMRHTILNGLVCHGIIIFMLFFLCVLRELFVFYLSLFKHLWVKY